ncbi:MAG: N-acetylmuramoyl-L-alanine amidase [Pseudobutyrivibrio sp.]|nr:N-acetylmuramoyl-L-alanine amidase [Pseudobutyrivibrio sp.]
MIKGLKRKIMTTGLILGLMLGSVTAQAAEFPEGYTQEQLQSIDWAALGMQNPLTGLPFTYPLDKDGKLVVVIDPGHGGTNEGALYGGTMEKYMTMGIAYAMKAELEKYEGVTVYLTHSSPEDTMSIEDRAKFAAAVSADFIFSIHLNAKANHSTYGAEVWIPLESNPYNKEVYKFAAHELEELTKLGMFNRGVKTKPGPQGEYYGILRYATTYGVPACIIEHCHMDNDNDLAYWATDEARTALGVADATAVAKYFGLKSTALKVDYSAQAGGNYANYSYRDETAPDSISVAIKDLDATKGIATLEITGEDKQTPIMYYSVSNVKKDTNPTLIPWPGTDVMANFSPNVVTVEVQGVTEKSPLYVTIYNKYDSALTSEPVDFTEAFAEANRQSVEVTYEPEEEEIETPTEEYRWDVSTDEAELDIVEVEDIVEDTGIEEEGAQKISFTSSDKTTALVMFSLALVAGVAVMACAYLIIKSNQKNKKRRNRR